MKNRRFKGSIVLYRVIISDKLWNQQEYRYFGTEEEGERTINNLINLPENQINSKTFWLRHQFCLDEIEVFPARSKKAVLELLTSRSFWKSRKVIKVWESEEDVNI